MTKLYFTLIAVFSFGMLSAQNSPASSQIADAPADVIDSKPLAKPATSKEVNIWEEDFGNGFPSAWSIDNPSGILPWVYSTDGTWGNFNGNNATAAGVPISSTTAANGFLICDADSANHFTYGQPSGSNYQYLASYFTTDAIDCLGHPAVLLEFQQMFRINNSIDLEVMVSNDSINWTTWTVQGNAVNNVQSPDPELISLNISAVAGNQPTVYLKIGWSARVYFWMIDDMRIIDAPADDMSLSNESFEDTLEYHYIPVAHAQPMTFSAFLSNEGANPQTNVQLQADVVNIGGTNVFSGTSTGTTFNPLDTNTVTVSNTFTPSVIDDYSIYWTATQNETDLVPSNDSATQDFSVTGYEYGRDNGIYNSQYWNGEDGNGASYAFEYGTRYEMGQDDHVAGIKMYIGTNADPGALVYGVLYDYDDGNFLYINSTPDHVIAANELGTWITVPFTNPEPIDAGFEYIACAGHYGGFDRVYIGRADKSSDPQTSFLLDGIDNIWYYTTRMPMVRIMLEEPISVEEVDTDFNINFFPNPSDGNSKLQFELAQASDVVLDVYDVSGKLVYSERFAQMSAGVHQKDIQLSELAGGVYTARVRVDSQVQSTMLTITK